MGKRREHLIRLLLIVVIIGCLTHTSWGQEEDSVKIPYPSSLPARSEFSQEDIVNNAQKSLDSSISILNIVASLMGVMVGLLALIFVILGAWGFTEIRHWKELRGEIEKDANEAKKSAEEAKKAAEEAKPIIDRLKKAEEEIDTFRERATHLPSLSEPFSEDQKRLLEEYGKKIEFLEAFGVPLKPEDYLRRGDDFYQSNEYKLALKAYDKAIELKPDFAVAWHNRGVALDKLGRHDEALKAYDNALELKPDFAVMWTNRGLALDILGRYGEALKAFDKAIELKPDSADAWVGTGLALDNLGRYEEALEASDKAIELKPDFAEAWNNKGFLLAKLDRYDEALKAIDKAVELKPDYAEAWDSRGFALAKLDRYDEALKAIDKAIELKPDYAEAWFHKACAYSLKGDKENALKHLSKAIALDAKYKEEAKSDEDLKNLWDDEDFKRIVS